jgi:hypothetical protein
MPNTEDHGEEEFEESEEETEDEGVEEESEGSDDKAKPSAEKRIRDLQAKADAAEARANKAEKLLTAKRDGDTKGANDPARDAVMTELREAGLDAIFATNPLLKDYDIDRSLIEGSTRAELRESAATLVALVKSVETKARNRALKDAGINPAPETGARSKPKDIASMSDEDFEKLVQQGRSGGAPIW